MGVLVMSGKIYIPGAPAAAWSPSSLDRPVSKRAAYRSPACDGVVVLGQPGRSGQPGWACSCGTWVDRAHAKQTHRRRRTARGGAHRHGVLVKLVALVVRERGVVRRSGPHLRGLGVLSRGLVTREALLVGNRCGRQATGVAGQSSGTTLL